MVSPQLVFLESVVKKRVVALQKRRIGEYWALQKAGSTQFHGISHHSPPHGPQQQTQQSTDSYDSKKERSAKKSAKKR